MKIWPLLLSTLFCFANEPLQPLPSSLIIPDTCELKISTPSFEKRSVVKVRLENELEAYIVSDPQLKESAIALTVATGQWDDPKEAYGLAHFVEHMLFMGSEKYPSVDEFCTYVSDNGGKRNAFTSSTQTCYMFSVRNHALEGAVDRFVPFFTSPLFKEECLADERKAVDQEFMKSIEQDHMRLYMIEKQLADKEHPFAKFGCGNLSTLSSLSRSDVVSWYEKHYSSNLMRLVVYSPKPLAELKTLVEKQFSAIPNRKLAATGFSSPMISLERKGQMVYLPPVQESRHLQLMWELPAHLAEDTTHHVSRLIGRILADESPGTLLKTLKTDGLANTISASQWRMSQNSGLFFIDISLTEKGTEQHEEVLKALFSHLSALRTSGIPRYLFEDMQKTDLLEYEYQTPDDGFRAAWSAGSQILWEEMSSFPTKASVVSEFETSFCDQYLSLLTPKNSAIGLIGDSALTGKVTSEREQWTGASFAIEKMRPEQLRAWETAASPENFALPTKNPFLPEALPAIKVQNSEAPSRPVNIENSDFGRFYYETDRQFFIPKVSCTFSIKTPKTDITAPRSAAYVTLFMEMLSHQTHQISYLASGADMHGAFGFSRGALRLHVSGWSPSISPLMRALVTELKSLQINRDTFDQAKERALHKLRIAQKQSPLNTAMGYTNKIMCSTYLPHEVERALLPLQLEDFNRFFAAFFKNAHVESIMTGALSQPESSALKDDLLKLLQAKSFPPSEHAPQRALLFQEDSAPIALKQNYSMSGNAALLHIQSPDQTLEGQVIQELLTKAIGTPFFDELRSNQQTGYINHAFMRTYENVPMTTLAVQSTSHTPEELVARYELFLESYLKKIETNLSPERFERIRSSLIEEYSEPPHDLDELSGQRHHEAFDYSERFDLINEKIAYAKELSHRQVLDSAQALFGRSNNRRLAILIEGNSSTKDLRYNQMKSPRHIQRSGELTSFNDAQIFTP